MVPGYSLAYFLYAAIDNVVGNLRSHDTQELF